MKGVRPMSRVGLNLSVKIGHADRVWIGKWLQFVNYPREWAAESLQQMCGVTSTEGLTVGQVLKWMEDVGRRCWKDSEIREWLEKSCEPIDANATGDKLREG